MECPHHEHLRGSVHNEVRQVLPDIDILVYGEVDMLPRSWNVACADVSSMYHRVIEANKAVG